MLVLLIIFWKIQGTLKLRFSEWSIWGATPRRIIRIGVPAAWDGILSWMGQYVYLYIISQLDNDETGSSIFAAHIIGVRLEGICYLTATAWGQAAATLVGQSLGAEKPLRARQSGHEAVYQCAIPIFFVSLFFFFGSEIIYHWMHTDPRVIAAGSGAFKLLAWVELPLMMSIIYICALRGAGNTFVPFLINMLGIFLVRLPFAWLFGIYLDGGLIGAWTGMAIDTIFRAILVWLYYIWGPWDRTVV
ncbi:MAG: MATE family efflux transporter [Planctomycetaceae bacterium]